MSSRHLLLRLYMRACRLLPQAFRDRHIADLEVTERALLQAAASRGALPLVSRFVRDLVDVCVIAMRLHAAGPAVRTAPNSMRKARPMDLLLQELRHSGRKLMRSPGFTLAAVLTLGAGVGFATGAYAALDAVVLQSLPHRASEALYMVWQRVPEFEIERAPMSYPTLIELRENTRAFAGLEAYTGGASALVVGDAPERLTGARVTGGLFALLGNAAQLGRTVLPADDAPGVDPVAVISWQTWQSRFGGDPTVLGQTLDVGDAPHRIVGVMPRDFIFPSERAQFWVPLRMDPAVLERDMSFLVAIARLREGADEAAAAASVDAVYGRLRTAYPDAYGDRSVHIESRLTYLVGEASRFIWLAAAAGCVLLLVACANLGNLLLMRGVTRANELGVRAALGASRRRLAATLLGEGLWLGAGAAALALLIAQSLLALILVLGPADLPRRAELALGGRAIAFAIAAAMVGALVCALLPGLGGVRRATSVTRDGSLARHGRRVQGGLVVTQVSLAFVLLVATLLLTGTLTRLLAVPVGFDGERVLSAWISLPAAQYDDEIRIAAFHDQLAERLAARPEVERVGATWALPFSEDYAFGSVVAADAPEREPLTAFMTPVRGQYFDAVGMRIVRGRDFDVTDHADAAPVAIINETLARRLWPDRDAVGQMLGDPDDPDDRTRVIGVVNDVRRRELAADAEPEIYLPHAQATWNGNLYLTVRTTGDPRVLIPTLRAEVRALDPRLPLARVATMDDLVTSSVATPRFRAALGAAFSVAAVLITLLGIFAVQAAYAATHRRDAAVRLALGARPGQVVGSLTGRGLRLSLIGLALGVAAAAVSTRVLQSVLFGLSPLDPVTFIVAAAGFLAAAGVASYLPVRAVARLDAVRVLRES